MATPPPNHSPLQTTDGLPVGHGADEALQLNGTHNNISRGPHGYPPFWQPSWQPEAIVNTCPVCKDLEWNNGPNQIKCWHTPEGVIQYLKDKIEQQVKWLKWLKYNAPSELPEKSNTCPICIEVAELYKIPVATTHTHTQEELIQYLDEKAQRLAELIPKPAAPTIPFRRTNTCPMCIELAKLNKSPVATNCDHTPEQLKKYLEEQNQPSTSKQEQADPPVRKTCKGCAVMGGTKKKSRRLRRRKSKSKIQRRGKSVKRRRQ